MSATELAVEVSSSLVRQGFVVIPGPCRPDEMSRLARSYDDVMASTTGPDLRVGSTTTRVHDLVNRGEAFDALYVFAPLVDACRLIIGRPFKLSSLVARTLRPRMPAQGLHVDVNRESADWPLVGFILMVDEFRPENGATCFVPGSQRWPSSRTVMASDGRLQACGPPGSLLIFNGSVVHGHSANITDTPRRSLHGAFIPREGKSATDFGARMNAQTRARLSPPALELLSLPPDL